MLLFGRQNSVSSILLFHDWIHPAIMLVQMSICVFAWTFAGSMMRTTVPLQDSTATWIQNNPGDTNVIVTLVSTILGLINSL